MIRVEHLTKHYGPRVAVADVTFHVEKGEILGFLGPNGAGKTTTMRMLTGYLPPTSGRAEVNGFDVVHQSLKARGSIGYLPEAVPMHPEMSVRSYLDYLGKLTGVRNRRAAVNLAMEKARIEHRAKDQIGKLSKGLRQRVGIAQALLGDPPVLIMDEPTSGLDPKQIIDTRNLIKSLQSDHTVVLSTHILPEVAATCSRVVIIANGRVVAEDTPENLDRRLKGAESLLVAVRGKPENVVAALRRVPKVLKVEPSGERTRGQTADVHAFSVECAVHADVRESIAQAVVQGGWGLLEMRQAQMNLEEIFLQLTREGGSPS
ncbi:MAG: ABC transporter ATP-binding protein [Chloroflexi bacterium]|nr:ABC transporter ATP-binding protein [Chloroflexota bacterium]